MPKVPELNLPKPKPPKIKMIICTTDGKPLDPEDQKALDEYIAFRANRAKKAKVKK